VILFWIIDDKHVHTKDGNTAQRMILMACLQIGCTVQTMFDMPVPSQGHYGFHSFPVVD
jgi:hypothetical protein